MIAAISWPLIFSRPGALWLVLLVPLVVWLPARLGRRQPFGRVIALLRLLTLALLIVALAEPLLVRAAPGAPTIFVVDQSNSIGPAAAEGANRWVTQALRQGGSADTAAIVTFGAEPRLAVPAAQAGTVANTWEQSASGGIDGQTTDLSSALALSRALPVGDGRRIVVLSDGAENTGQAIEQADQAAQDGVPIDVVPLGGVNPNDLRIDSVSGPGTVWSGDKVTVLANAWSGSAGNATLTLTIDGQQAAKQSVPLQPGGNAVTFTAPKLAAGFHAMQVTVAGPAAADPIPQNDTGVLSLVVRDQPSVLLVEPQGADGTRIAGALTAQGARVTTTTPDRLPGASNDLAGYDSIVLDNVPAWSVSTAQQNALVDRTKNGGGLVVLGGTASYGPGAYAGTPLENALPVTVRVTEGRQRPRVALLLVMDKSGSMSYGSSGSTASKIDMAKEAVREAVGALSPGDQVGVLAFNDQPQWVLPMTTLTGANDQQRIDASLDQLSADGGTEIYPALQVAYDTMRNVPADVRHIVLITDGKSQSGNPASYQRLVQDVGNDQITLSTIAIGDDADTGLLQTLATDGGGRFHQATKPEDIPRFTVEEAKSAGSQSILRGAFAPIQVNPSPILDGFTAQQLPKLDGYDYVQTKPDAQTILTSDRQDPVLAKWQFGLGRVVSWTADDGSDLASQWGVWSGYDQFWGNTLRWSLPDPTNGAVRVTAARDGPDVTLTVDSTTNDGQSVDLAGSAARITAANGATIADTRLTQNQPGHYTVRLPRLADGAYQVTVTGANGQRVGGLAAFAVPPSPEWQPDPNGAGLLKLIAGRTGGRVLSIDSPPPADLYLSGTGEHAHTERVVQVWQYPLVAAMALLILELALRLGVMHSSWTRRAR